MSDANAISFHTTTDQLKAMAGMPDQPGNLSVALVKVFKLPDETSGQMMSQIKVLTPEDKEYFKGLFKKELGWVYN